MKTGILNPEVFDIGKKNRLLESFGAIGHKGGRKGDSERLFKSYGGKYDIG